MYQVGYELIHARLAITVQGREPLYPFLPAGRCIAAVRYDRSAEIVAGNYGKLAFLTCGFRGKNRA